MPILSHHSLASYLWFSSASGYSPAFQTLTYSGLLIFWIFVLSLVLETLSLTWKSLPLLCCHSLSSVPLSCSLDICYICSSIWMQCNQLRHLVCPRHSKLRNSHCICTCSRPPDHPRNSGLLLDLSSRPPSRLCTPFAPSCLSFLVPQILTPFCEVSSPFPDALCAFCTNSGHVPTSPVCLPQSLIDILTPSSMVSSPSLDTPCVLCTNSGCVFDQPGHP